MNSGAIYYAAPSGCTITDFTGSSNQWNLHPATSPTAGDWWSPCTKLDKYIQNCPTLKTGILSNKTQYYCNFDTYYADNQGTCTYTATLDCTAQCPAATPHKWPSNGNCYKCPEGQVWLDDGQGTAACQTSCAGLTGDALAACEGCDVSGGAACRCDQLEGVEKQRCFCSAFGGGQACFSCSGATPHKWRDGTCHGDPQPRNDRGNNPGGGSGSGGGGLNNPGGGGGSGLANGCGKLGDNADPRSGASSGIGQVGNPFDVGSRIKSETVSCLKLPEGRAGIVGVGLFWSSGAWEMGLGDADLGTGWTTGYSSRVLVGTGEGHITRTLRVVGEGDVDFTYDASAQGAYKGPYYPLYLSEALSPSWIVEEKTTSGTLTGYLLTRRDGSKIHYKADGSLDWLKDTYGNQTTVTLENSGALKRIKNEATGQSLELVYGLPAGLAQRRLLQIRDAAVNRPAGSTEPLRSVALAYDAQGRLSQVNEDFGQGNVAVRSYDYDAQGRPYRMYDANNGPGVSVRRSTETTYEGTTGRVTGQLAASGVSTTVTQVSQPGWNYEVTLNNDPTLKYRYLVNGDGRVTRKYEVGANAYTAFAYNMAGLLQRVTDPTGRTVDYEYDRRTRALTRSIEAKGTADEATTQMFYDPAGRLTKTIDPMGRVAEFTYCTAVTATCGVVGAPLSSVDKGLNGTATARTTQYETNAYGQVVATVAPDGTRITTTYDSRGLPATTTLDPSGLNLATSMVHDWRGYLRQVTDTRGTVTKYEVNGRGWVTAEIADDVVGGWQQRTETTYDNLGQALQTIEDAGGLSRTTQMVYDFVGNDATYQMVELREAVGTPAARTTTFGFNVLGELTQVEKPYLGTGSARPTLLQTFTYQRGFGGAGTLVSAYENGALLTATHHDTAGRPIASTDAAGVKSTMSYTGRGQLAQSTVGAQAVGANPAINATTSYTYFADGSVMTTTTPGGGTRTHAYDPYGRLETTTEAAPGATARWTKSMYDLMGRVTRLEEGSGPTTERRADRTYDRAGRTLTEALDPAGLNLVTTYAYTDTLDPADKVHLRKVTDPKGNVTRHRYDSLGHLVETLDPANTSFTYSYDDLGRLATQAGAGRAQSFDYDLLDRKVAATSALGTERWVYSPGDMPLFSCPVAGQSGACDATNAEAVTSTFTTAANERIHLLGIDYPEMSGVQSPDASYTYTASNQLATVEDSDGQTTYTYDALGRMLTKTRTPKDGGGSLLAAEAKTISYAYKANDLPLASIQYWNRGSVSYTTNGLHQLTGSTDWSGTTHQYGYRATGQLASAAVNSGTAFAAAYSYDTAGRLARVQRTQAGSNLLDLQYAPSGLQGRDGNGNLQSIREAWQGESALTTQYTYDNLDRLFVAQYPSLPGIDWTGIHAYEYDAAGNVTARHDETDEELTFSYDPADRLTTEGFSYDANGSLLTTGQVTSTPSFE